MDSKTKPRGTDTKHRIPSKIEEFGSAAKAFELNLGVPFLNSTVASVTGLVFPKACTRGMFIHVMMTTVSSERIIAVRETRIAA